MIDLNASPDRVALFEMQTSKERFTTIDSYICKIWWGGGGGEGGGKTSP